MEIRAIPAYNIDKEYHPRSNNWVGYLVTLDRTRYYIAGDTDLTEESKKVKCDYAFLPIGGTYTMDAKEAATLAKILKPKRAIPIHFGEIVGSEKDEEEFLNLIK